MTAIEFNYEVTSLQEKLKYYALKLTTNMDDANDLLQETMFKAFKNREKFSPKTNLNAWLYTIMKNTFINNYRKKKRARTIIDQTDEQYFLNIPQDSGLASPDVAYSTKEIIKEINALEDEYRTPFTMHNDGYKYKEIAEHMDLPIGTVKSRIFLARKKLMNRLSGHN